MTRKKQPDQKVIRFNNPRFKKSDTKIWPWLIKQSNLHSSLTLLITAAQNKWGNCDLSDVVRQAAKRYVMKSMFSGSGAAPVSKQSSAQISGSNKSQSNTANHRSSRTRTSHQDSGNGMSSNELKNAFR